MTIPTRLKISIDFKLLLTLLLFLRFLGEYRGAFVAVKYVPDIENYLKEGDLFFEVCLHPNVCRCFGLHQRTIKTEEDIEVKEQ